MSSQSPTIAALAAALAKAQGEIKGAMADSENPHFRSSYADLASIWDACRAPLAKNGLAVIQTTEGMSDTLVLVTTLAHASGEWIQGKLSLKPVKADPQGMGSALTYARRYALAAIVGVAPVEDDDGESAQGRPTPPADRPAPIPRATPKEPQPRQEGECPHEWAPSRYKADEEYCAKKCGAKRKKAA